MRIRPILFAAFLIGAPTPSIAAKDDVAPENNTQPQHYDFQLRYYFGNIWGGSFHLVVDRAGFSILEHEKCKDERERHRVEGIVPQGFCTKRISDKKFQKFAQLMEPLRKFAKPTKPSRGLPRFVRPDGGECTGYVTDHALITLTWIGTRGVEVARFYTGCDREELKDVYARLYEIPRSMTNGDPFK